MKKTHVVDHNDIVRAMFELHTGRSFDHTHGKDDEIWNQICNQFDNDLEGDYTRAAVTEMVEEDPEGLMAKALQKIMTEEKMEEMTIVR